MKWQATFCSLIPCTRQEVLTKNDSIIGDVTILTVGFGDLYPEDDIGRGLVFPYTVGGTIMLGLVIGSLTRFTKEISNDQIVRKRTDTARKSTIERSQQAEERFFEDSTSRGALSISSPFDAHPSSNPVGTEAVSVRKSSFGTASEGATQNKGKTTFRARKPHRQRYKLRAVLLREEKDRFDAMRRIQHSTHAFKRYAALAISVFAFGALWCVGAAVFYVTEKHTQGLSYFRALYFAYVSLLTIGYGDEAPKSNAGRPFFVVWSLLAVPTMTILVSDMGDTVINSFKKGTSVLADFTILPKYGIWRNFLNHNPWLLFKLQRRAERKAIKKRIGAGFEAGPEGEEDDEGGVDMNQLSLDGVAQQDTASPPRHELARKLAHAIRRTAQHLKDDELRRYSYEEWVEITQLIRFSSKKKQRVDPNTGEYAIEVEREEERGEEDLVEWDWIGEDSPMMAFGKSEPEFVLDRLCESMVRYLKVDEEAETS